MASMNPVQEHVIRILETDRRTAQAQRDYAETLERSGHRLVDGGQTGPDTWEICDGAPASC